MTTKLINPIIDLKKKLWDFRDDRDKNFVGIKNIREYEDDLKKMCWGMQDYSDDDIKTYTKTYINKEEDCIETSRYIPYNENQNLLNYSCEVSFYGCYIFDYVLKIPYHKDLDINKDILELIVWEIGAQIYTSSNMYILEFYNWLFDKEINIKDGYLYLPLSNNINMFHASSAIYHRHSIYIKFTKKYIDFLNKLNESAQSLEKKPLGLYSWIMNGFKDIKRTIKPKFRIELLHKQYYILPNQLLEKLNFNIYDYEQKIIQNQNFSKSVEGKINDIVNIEIRFNNPIFCLFVYGFDKNDISDVHDFPGKSSNLFNLSEAIKDVQLVINEDNFVYDMMLKEKTKNIYVLEFADPLLFNTIFDEPISNTNIFNKKTINFSRIDTCIIRFKKTNNKSFEFNIVGLNYNFMKFLSGMAGLFN